MTWTTQPRSKMGDLAAIVHGAGSAVMFLHGVGLRAEAWGAQFKLPARIVAPDMPGHGESPWQDTDDLQLGGYVQAAETVLVDIDQPTVVVGHSMGAMLALELANRRPDKVRAVAALNAVFERSAVARKLVQDRADELDGKSIPDQTPTLRRWFGDEDTAERRACENWLQEMNPAAYSSAYTAFASSLIPDRQGLANISCPALFMTGSKEPNSTPQMSRAMAELAPRGRAVVVEGAAHMMPMTHHLAVNRALTALIEDVTP